MKNIKCAVCGIGISPFVQTWSEFLEATKGWKKFYCLGEQQHDLELCPDHYLVKCTECGEEILSERELNELNAEQDTGSRF